MKLVWHIVKKDAWQQRYLVAGVVIAATALAVSMPRFNSPATMFTSSIRQVAAGSGVAAIVLVVVSWLLIAALVHAEGLAGTNEHWLSRPVSSGKLLAAKALGVFLFIVVPLMLLQVVALSAAGFAFSDYWLAMLTRTSMVVATWIVPVFGLAAITRNWQQLGAGLVCILALGAGLAALAGGFLFEPPVEFYVVVQNGFAVASAVVAAAIAIWQYQTRRVRAARIAAALGFCAAILGPTHFSPALYSAASRLAPSTGDWRQGVRIIADSTRKTVATPNQSLPNMALVTVPLRVEGLPAGLSASLDMPLFAQLSSAGQVLAQHRNVQLRTTDELNVSFNVNRFQLQRFESLQIHAHAYITVRAAERRFAMPTLGGSLRTPELGHCQSWVSDRLHILSLRPYEFASTIRGFLTRGEPRSLNLQVFAENPEPWPFVFEPLPMPFTQSSGGLSVRNLDQGEEYRDTSIVFEVSDVLSRIEQDIVIDVPVSEIR